MKKSEAYLAAQLAVIEADFLSTAQKVDVIETLMEDKKLAIWREEQEANK